MWVQIVYKKYRKNNIQNLTLGKMGFRCWAFHDCQINKCKINFYKKGSLCRGSSKLAWCRGLTFERCDSFHHDGKGLFIGANIISSRFVDLSRWHRFMMYGYKILKICNRIEKFSPLLYQYYFFELFIFFLGSP